MVTELTSSWALAEYRMALARINSTSPADTRRKPLHLIIVATDNEQLPALAQEFPVIRRPNIVREDPDAFIQQLGEMLQGIAAKVGVQRRAEPERLLQMKEYRAAVISAMTLLEAKLRDRLGKNPWPQSRGPMPMRSLVALGVRCRLADARTQTKLDGWMRIRNELVHSSMDIARSQATEIVTGVLEAVNTLQ